MKNNWKKTVIALWTAAAVCLLCLQGCSGTPNLEEHGSAAADQAGETKEESAAEGTNKASEKASEEETSKQAAELTATPASVEVNEAEGEAAEASGTKLSPAMNALKEKIEKEFAEEDGRWSMYLYRLDDGEEFGVNEKDSMISASLIKLFIA